MYSRLTPEQNLKFCVRVARAVISTGNPPSVICRELGFQLYRYKKFLKTEEGLKWRERIAASKATAVSMRKAAGKCC